MTTCTHCQNEALATDTLCIRCRRAYDVVVQALVCLECDHPPIRFAPVMQEHQERVHGRGTDYTDPRYREVREYRIGDLIEGKATR